jgi:cyclic-di-GMP phosphodiesterase TipF (flagellum assembly factor)
MSDVFVVCAMTLVAVALGTGLHLQLAMGAMHALAAAGSVWFGLLAVHLLIRRAQTGTAATARPVPVQRPRPDLGRLAASPVTPRRRQPDTASGPTNRSEPPPLPATGSRHAARDAASDRSPAAQTTTMAHTAEARPSLDETTATPRAMGWDVRPRDTLAATPRPAVFPPLEQTVAAALKANNMAARTAGAEHAHDAPATGARPAQRGAAAGGLEGRPPLVPPRPPASDATAEANASKSPEIQSMQTVIEQLARQLNTPVESGATAEQAAASAASPEQGGAEQAITRSIEALKAASGAMRHVAATPRPAAGATRAAAGNPAAAVDPGTARIAAAIASNQYEVYLDSIAGLADHKTRHFDITLRVRIDGGPAPDADDCAGLLGSGAGTRLDAAKLVRVAQIASRLSSRGASAALFTRLMPESLIDDMVLETCAEIVGRDAAIGRQLVLSFRQAAIRSFAKDHWETLATLSENGLRFAVEEVSDLAMDFDVLKTRGFHFVKIDAAALLAGMQAHDGIIAPADACRRLAETGLSLIVGGVLDDATVTWALGLGAPYGQGALFSSPRPVKDLGSPQDAAA